MGCIAATIGIAQLGGCLGQQDATRIVGTPNRTDRTNAGATPVGTAACSACHSDKGSRFAAGRHADVGLGCESCHGPGGSHFSTRSTEIVIDVSRIFIDPDGSQTCATCHSQTLASGGTTILAADGFILPMQQWSELKASGGHAGFACTFCHDPHGSVAVDRRGAIRNECTACHAEQTTAGHGGDSIVIAGRTETLSCESCHMTYAGRSQSSTSIEGIGPGRQGDLRTHIVRISSASQDYRSFFTPDGSAVALDSQGRAAVTVDFACLRCHNDAGVPLFRPGQEIDRAAEIAPHIHDLK